MKTGTSGSVSSSSPAEIGSSTSDEREHRHRHDDGKDDLRQIPRERRLQRADSRHGERRDLAALRTVERRRLRAQPLRHEIEPQLREDRRGTAPPGHLEAPGEQRASGEHGDEQDDARLDLCKRRAVERPRDDPCQQQRLTQHEQRRADTERRVDAEQHPCRPRAPQQSAVEHDYAAGASPPTRARNT